MSWGSGCSLRGRTPKARPNGAMNLVRKGHLVSKLISYVIVTAANFRMARTNGFTPCLLSRGELSIAQRWPGSAAGVHVTKGTARNSRLREYESESTVV
jgi:hypothetical protein